MEKRLKRIRHIWQNADEPRKALKAWANRPKKLGARLRRWRAVLVFMTRKRLALIARGNIAAAKRLKPFRKVAKGRVETLQAKRATRRRKRQRKINTRPGPPGWGACRAVTDYVIAIVGHRARVTSRKRAWGNLRSHHNVLRLRADAVDFGIANAHWLAQEIRRKLTGDPNARHVDYQWFEFTLFGLRFRAQLIASTHGTGPHLHFGLERA